MLTASATPPDADGFRLADDALLLLVHDGSGRLIDLSGQVSAITESGAAMLDLALRHGTEYACVSLATRYRVTPETISADIATLFKSLERQGILVPTSAAPNSRSLRRLLTWIFYPVVVTCSRRPGRWPETKATLLMIVAFLATRMFGWANAVRVWDRAGTKLQATFSGGEPDPAVLATLDSAVLRAIARHPLTVNCKERAMTAWVLARATGHPARLTLGVDLLPFGLHCWCEHGAAIIADRYEGQCDRYTPILTYG